MIVTRPCRPIDLAHVAAIWHGLPADRRGHIYVELNRNEFYAPARVLGIAEYLRSHRPPSSPDPVLIAGGGDLVAGAQGRPAVLIEHGAGQAYVGVDSPSYSGGIGRDAVRLFLCPNEVVAARNAQRYPQAVQKVVGAPTVKTGPDRARNCPIGPSPQDVWSPSSGCPDLGKRAGCRADSARTSGIEVPVIAVTWHWDCPVVPETRTGWHHWSAAALTLARELPVLGHAHPRIAGQILPWWATNGVQSTGDFATVLRHADVLVCDNSSVLYEFAATGRPVVVLDNPWYRRDVEHGLRFWSHADVGIRTADTSTLTDAVLDALDDPPEVAERRTAITTAIWPYTGDEAVGRAVDAVLDLADHV